MGWNPFKSKRVTSVGTSVVRLIKDENLTDSTKAILAASMFSKTDFVDEILEASLNSLGTRAERMYRYAQNNSPYGLPTGEVYANTQGKAQLQAVLDTLEGQPVFIEYHRFGCPNGIHMGWMTLIEYHGYDPVTNKLMGLSTEKGTPVYLKDMVLEVPALTANDYDREEVAVWGKTPNGGYTPERTVVTSGAYAEAYYPASPVVFTNGLLNPQLKVSYTWQENVEVVPDPDWRYSSRKSYELQCVSSAFSMPYRDVDLDAGYFHVKYVVGGITKYWMYRYGAGTHPTLDAVFVGAPDTLGDFYPNIYFRLNKVNLSTDKTTAAYRTNNKLTKILGFDYDDITAAIHENADIAYVEQGFLTMGVPADTTNPLEQEYLFNFFDALHDVTDAEVLSSSDNFRDVGIEQTAPFPWSVRPTLRAPAAETITIKDAAFQMDLSNSGISKSRVSGSIGAIGAVSSGRAEFVYQTPVHTTYGEGATTMVSASVPYRFYRKQISKNFYEEIQVVNAQMKYWILGGHHTVLGDQSEEILLIPIDRGILKEFNSRDAELLISRSLHLVFNSLAVTKVRWYQQEWFGIVLLIIAIVLTVLSCGEGSPSIEAALAIIAGMSAYEILIWIALKVLIYVAVREVFKLFVKAVGVEVAYIAAIIAMASGIKVGLEGNPGMFAGFEVSAATMMQTVSGIVQGINTELRSLNADLMGEMTRFNILKQEQVTLLDKAKDLLDSDSILSPFVVLGESPQDYFKRTIHSGNIGTILIDDVHNYVSRNLQLPDFSTSVGGPKYGS